MDLNDFYDEKIGLDYSPIGANKIIHNGVNKICEVWGLKIIGQFEDGDKNIPNCYGVVAYELQDNNKQKSAVFVIPSLLKYYSGGVGKSLNKKIVDHCAKNNMDLFVYVIDGNYFYRLNPKIIQEKYSNKLDNFNGQEMYNMINFEYIRAENMNPLRKKKQNKPELLLTHSFRENNLPIFYTGSGEQQFYISNKRPDWKVEGQKKVIEYCGTYWHTKEEIEERKELFKIAGYEVFIIWEGDEKNLNELIDKIKEFISI